MAGPVFNVQKFWVLSYFESLRLYAISNNQGSVFYA